MQSLNDHAKRPLMVGLRRAFQLRGNRCFSVTSNLRSGHNRWSKIKHDKAKVDVCAEQEYGNRKELTKLARPR